MFRSLIIWLFLKQEPKPLARFAGRAVSRPRLRDWGQTGQGGWL